MDSEQRLDRIDSKLDKITDQMVNLRAIEVGINNINTRLNRHEWRLDENETLAEKTAIAVARMQTMEALAVKAFWMALSTLIGSFGFILSHYVLKL
jgi:hypothetical protein